jgi:hypothetical protein
LVRGGSPRSRKFLPTLTWVQVERGTPFGLVELTNIDDAASGNKDALPLSPMLRNGDDALHARKNQDDCNNQDDRNQLEKKYLQNST